MTGTRIGTGYVTVVPDFSGFQEKVAKRLNETLGPAMDRAGANASKRLSKSLGNNSSLRSSFAPLLKRFQKFGDDAGEEIASHIGKGSKRASGDMFGLSGAIKEMERRSSSASSRAKIFANDTFGIAHAARDAGQSYKLLRNATRDWSHDAKAADSVGKRLSKGITSLFSDLGHVGRNLKAAAGGFGNFEGIMARANRGFQFFRNVLGSLKVPALVAGVALLAQSLSALAAGAVATISALGPLSGALVALPAAALAGAQAVGVLKLALSGIGAAVKTGLTAQIKGGEQATQTLRTQENAAEALADAHRTLSSSERDAKYAQEDLNKARKEATRQLEDMRIASEESGLTEREGTLALREARRELNKTLREPGATGLDIQGAEQAVEQAKFGLEETRVDAKRARADYAEAQKKGVEGMPEVVSAKRALADANRSVADAERGVAKAVRDNTDAMKQQGSAATALQQKMAALTPTGRKFAKFLISLKPQFDSLRETAAQGLFPGAEKGLKSALGNLSVVKKVVRETSGALGKLAAKAGAKLGSKAWGRDLGKVGEMNTRILTRMGDAGLNVADAFRNILVSAEPLLEWMSKGTLKFSEWLKTSAQAGRETGSLGHFFDETREAMEKVWHILKPLGEGLLNVGHAARPLGNEILDSLGKAAQGWAAWTKSTEGQNKLKRYFVEVKPAIFAIGRLVRDATDDFAELGRQKGVATLVESIRKTLLPLLTKGSGVITGFVSDFLNQFNHLRKEGLPAFDAFVQTLAEHAGEAGVRLAGALGRGFLNASVWGKLAISGWLIQKFGAGGVIARVGLAIGRLLAKTTAAQWAIEFGRAMGQRAIEFGRAIQPAVTKIAMVFGRALGPAMAAIGIANIVTSATQKDWKDAGFEAGGALAGGIAGFFLSGGNPLAAMAGVGVGSIAGELLSGLFPAEKKLTPVQKALAASAERLGRALRSQRNVAGITTEAHDNLRTADHKLHQTTRELTKAEQRLEEVRESQKPGVIEVFRAEVKLHDARRANKKAANEQRFAEEELAFAKKAQGRSIAQVVHDSSLAVAADKRWVEQIKHRISVEGWSKEATEAAQRALKKLATDEGTRSQALGQARHRNVEWAKSLEEMTLSQHRFGSEGKALVDHIDGLRQKIHQLREQIVSSGGTPLSPFIHSLVETKRELRGSESRLLQLLTATGPKLKTWAQEGARHTEHLGGAFESLSGVVGKSLETILTNTAGTLKSFGSAKIPRFAIKHPNFVYGIGSSPNLAERQQGGPVPKRATGGLAGIVPGHSTGDSHTLSLNGVPVAKVESREGIFVGNRKMMAAAKQANDEHPRFPGRQTGGLVRGALQHLRTGGLVEPRLEGQAGALKQLGQQAIHKVFEGAKGYLNKHQPSGGLGGLSVPTGPITQMARQMVEGLWNRAEWAPFAALETREAGWNPQAVNPRSGAAGLAQALPPSKYPAGAWPYRGPESAKLQLQWMVQYIKERYGTPSGAWAHEQSVGWYKRGGLVKPATGGEAGDSASISAWRGIGASGLQSGIRNLAAYVMEKYPSLQVTSTTGGTHATDSYHPKGQAADLAGGNMDAAAGWIKSSGLYRALVEGIHNPNLSVMAGQLVNPSEWGSETWADHSDHIHLAVDHPWTASSFAGSESGVASKGGTEKSNEAIPPTYKGAKTGHISFGPIPGTLKAVNAEIKKWEGQLKVYRKARREAEKSGKPATATAISENLTAITSRLNGLRQRRTALRFKEVKKHLHKRLSRASSKLGGYQRMIEGAQQGYEGSSQFAEQVVDLEPRAPELVQQQGESDKAYEARQQAAEQAYVADYTKYIEGQERPAYAAVLEKVADWRNKILGAEVLGFGKGNPSVAAMQTAWEKQVREADNGIDKIRTFAKTVVQRKEDWVQKWEGEKGHEDKHPKASDLPKWLKDQLKERHELLRDKLPILTLKDTELRKSIGEAREQFFPGGENRLAPNGKGIPAAALPGSGTLEEQLVDVQGIHPFPEQHSSLDAGDLAPPRQAGRLGGAIWDVDSVIEELDLKVSQALNGIGSGRGGEAGGEGDSERASLLEQLLREANQRSAVNSAQLGALQGWDSLRAGLGDHLPKFHTGGIIPGPSNHETPIMARGGEGIFTEEQMAAMGAAGGNAGPPTIEHLEIHPDGRVTMRYEGREFEAAVERVTRRTRRGGIATPGGARR